MSDSQSSSIHLYDETEKITMLLDIIYNTVSRTPRLNEKRPAPISSTDIKIIGNVLKNSCLSESDAKKYFDKLNNHVRPNDKEKWEDLQKTSKDNTNGPLYVLARQYNQDLYTEFIRTIAPFGQKTDDYSWHDLIRDIKQTTFPRNRYIHNNTPRIPTLIEYNGEIEEWVMSRLPKCVRVLDTVPMKIVLKRDNKDTHQIVLASELKNSYNHLGVYLAEADKEKDTPKDKIGKYIFTKLFHYIISRLEIEHKNIDIIPYHADMGDPIPRSSPTLNMFKGFRARKVNIKPIPHEYQHYDSIACYKHKSHPYNKIYPLLNHTYEVFADGDMRSFIHIINVLAYPLRFPGSKSGVCLVLVGDPGCGKSIFFEFLSEYVYGDQISCVSTLEQITQRFNSIMDGKLLIVINETSAISDISNYHGKFDRLKSIVTDKAQAIERKGINLECSSTSHTTCVILSNHDHCVKIEQGDRRYAVYKCSNRYINNIAYYMELISCFDEETANMFYTFLRNLPKEWILESIGGSSIPNTQVRQSMMNSSKDKLQSAMDDILDGSISIPIDEIDIEVTGDNTTVFIPTTTLYDLYQLWMRKHAPTSKVTSMNVWVSIIKSRTDAFTETRRKIVNGKRHRGFNILQPVWSTISTATWDGVEISLQDQINNIIASE
jgi:hypothetical protein